MTTNDNLYLSVANKDPDSDELQAPAQANMVPPGAPNQQPLASRSIADYVAAAASDNTRRAYQSDLRAFLNWGGSLPSSPDAVAAYLVAHAATLSPVTLCRRLVAIARAHTTLGQPNPCRADLVKTTLKGIWRVHGRPQRQVQPAIREDVLAMLPHMTGTRGIRDTCCPER